MATKSILKNVVIRDKGLSKSLISALGQSLSDKDVPKFQTRELSRDCKTLKGNSIKEFFE